MIQPVDTASTPREAAKSAPPLDTSFATSFADLHADAVRREKPAKAAASAAASSSKETTSPARERIPVPDGETWEATKPGAHYARIVTGPRKGQCINLTHGERRGETFTIEQRAGKTLHVYTLSGKVVEVRPSADARAVSDAAKHVKHPRGHDHPRSGERWAPVEGAYNYADILGGPRNGLYVNTSGGIRDGMAFQIVKKGGKWFHVYGTGKDRQWIPSDGPKHKVHHTSPAAANGGTSAPGGTGGTSADTASGDTADASSNGTGGVAPPS